MGENSTWVTGNEISSTGRANLHLLLVPRMKESGCVAENMAEEFSVSPVENRMMDSSATISCMAMVCSVPLFSLEGKWTRGRLEGKVIYTQTNQSNRKVYHAMCRDNWLTFPENGFSPVEMPSLLTEVQLFPF